MFCVRLSENNCITSEINRRKIIKDLRGGTLQSQFDTAKLSCISRFNITLLCTGIKVM